MKKAEFFKRIDRIDPKYNMIYAFQINHTLSVAKLTSAALPFGMLGTFSYHFMNRSSGDEVLPYSDLFTESPEAYIAMYGLCVPAIVLFYIANRVILRIYKHDDSDDYIAVKASIIPTIPLKIPFKAGEVSENFTSKIPLLSGANYRLKNDRVFLMPHRFRTSMDLYKMLPAEQKKKYIR